MLYRVSIDKRKRAVALLSEQVVQIGETDPLDVESTGLLADEERLLDLRARVATQRRLNRPCSLRPCHFKEWQPEKRRDPVHCPRGRVGHPQHGLQEKNLARCVIGWGVVPLVLARSKGIGEPRAD